MEERDHTFSVNSDEILSSWNLNINSNVLGRLVKKLYPSVKVVCARGKVSGKMAKSYKGLTWTKQPIALPEDQSTLWETVTQTLPRTTLVISHTNDVLQCAIPSRLIVSGNRVLKEYTLQRSTGEWFLKISGKTIQPIQIGLDSKCDNIKCVDAIVNSLKLCEGKDLVQLNIQTGLDKFVQEFTCIQGDENSGCQKIRSIECDQILKWGADSSICRTCQYNISNCMKRDKSLNEVDVNLADTQELSTEDHKDLSVILDKIFPEAPVEMKKLLNAQLEALKSKSPNARRWSKDVISLCLSIWVRSPASYQNLKDSKMLILPSGRQLRRYKNVVPQTSGMIKEAFQWMYHAAKDAKLPPHGWAGGLHHDETKVQKDIVFQMVNGTPTLVGWVDVGDEGMKVKTIREQNVQQTIATQVLQLTFLGYTGFRFPICNFPTNGIKASELNIIVWDAVAKLSDWGFQVDYIMQDGGEENRQFTKLHFNKSPESLSYASPSLVDPNRTVYHVQDFSHNMKKLRNSVLSSGDNEKSTRKLILKNKSIVWDHWVQAVDWDRNTNSRPIHYKVTDTHLYPNGSDKMRNQLAEDMLDKNMLQLMECYQASLEDGNYLSSTVEFLKFTCQIISIFRDKRAIKSMTDDRFSTIHSCLNWFIQWRSSVRSNPKLTDGEKAKRLPSHECIDDTINMLQTFPGICRLHLDEFPDGNVTPARFNNDIAENIFCQQRGLYNGNTTNPTYARYCTTVNSVILGQSMKSRGRKSNVGILTTKPFSFYVPNQPLSKKKKNV